MVCFWCSKCQYLYKVEISFSGCKFRLFFFPFQKLATEISLDSLTGLRKFTVLFNFWFDSDASIWLVKQDVGRFKDSIKTKKQQSPRIETQNSLKQEVRSNFIVYVLKLFALWFLFYQIADYWVSVLAPFVDSATREQIAEPIFCSSCFRKSIRFWSVFLRDKWTFYSPKGRCCMIL